MKGIFVFLIGVLLLMGFSSCQKEVDGSIAGIVASDTVFLKRYVELDTTLVSGSDTTLIRDFQYDASKRIFKVVQQSIDHVHSISSFTEYIYFYNGASANPSMMIDYYFEIVPYTIDTTWFFYDASGQLIKDTSVENFLAPTPYLYRRGSATYTNSGNNTFIQAGSTIFTNIPPSISVHQGTVFKTYSNGNIITQTDTSGPGNSIVNSGSYMMTYDAMKNPFYKTEVHYPVIGGFNYTEDQQKNNFTEIKETTPVGILYHVKYSYTYRTDGYPMVVRRTDMLDPSFSRKGFFFY